MSEEAPRKPMVEASYEYLKGQPIPHADLVNVAISEENVYVAFVQVRPNQPKPIVVSEARISPKVAGKLVGLLLEMLTGYERDFRSKVLPENVRVERVEKKEEDTSNA